MIRLLFKILSTIEHALYLASGLIRPFTVVPTSDDECVVCVICFNDANCKGSFCKHHAVVNDHPSVTIVLDMLSGVNPCLVAEKGLKVLAKSIVEEATMDDVSNLFQKICGAL